MRGSTIKRVKENMAKPQALIYRGNTGNAGYGFEQVLGHNDGQVNIQGQYTGAGLFPGMVQDPGRAPQQQRFNPHQQQ